MNGLALCAGVGGLELGLETAFPEYRCIAAVENNAQAARRFRQRFPHAKVFRDVVGFDGRSLNGIVDCVSAGFPCQPHSVAGKRKGTTDERWLWPDIARIIGECGCSIVTLENVSGLLRDANGDPERSGMDDDADGSVFGGMGEVLRDLAQMGFVTAWGSLRASAVGASHGRQRVFILAYKPGRGFRIDGSALGESGDADDAGAGPSEDDSGTGRDVADPRDRLLSQPGRGREGRAGIGSAGEILGIATSTGLPVRGEDSGLRQLAAIERTGDDLDVTVDGRCERPDLHPRSARPGQAEVGASRPSGGLFAPGPSDPRWSDILATSPHLAPALSPVTAALAIAIQQGTFDVQEETESRFRGLADGVAKWLVERRPRLQCGGNGVVPLQAAAVFTVLAKRLGLLPEIC